MNKGGLIYGNDVTLLPINLKEQIQCLLSYPSTVRIDPIGEPRFGIKSHPIGYVGHQLRHGFPDAIFAKGATESVQSHDTAPCDAFFE
uniref:Uncharacterized protein n=1 Tax=Romanomermis culicivorax TaxID=13658 RepID=A0A915KUX4_ROMCU